MRLKNKSVVVVGQLKTSLTETLELYLKPRTKELGIIGIMSPFAPKNDSRCTLYLNGKEQQTWRLPAYTIKLVKWWNYPLQTVSYFIFIYNYFYSIRKLNRKFDLFIGVSTFSALYGYILKKLGIVNKVIYYCLDFYPDPKSYGFRGWVNFVFRKLEPFLVKHVDFVWDLSEKIKTAREDFLQVDPKSYHTTIVPVGYNESISRVVPLEKRNRWDIGFIGSISENQGLQLMVKTLPTLLKKFPHLKIHIIGHGTYAKEFKELVQKEKLNDYIIFHGFVSKEEDAYEIISHCVIGLAPYTGGRNDNAVFTEPGKPKLYMLLGVPIIITEQTRISVDIAKYGAGERIKYNEKDFLTAFEKMIADDTNLK